MLKCENTPNFIEVPRLAIHRRSLVVNMVASIAKEGNSRELSFINVNIVVQKVLRISSLAIVIYAQYVGHYPLPSFFISSIYSILCYTQLIV